MRLRCLHGRPEDIVTATSPAATCRAGGSLSATATSDAPADSADPTTASPTDRSAAGAAPTSARPAATSPATRAGDSLIANATSDAAADSAESTTASATDSSVAAPLYRRRAYLRSPHRRQRRHPRLCQPHRHCYQRCRRR